MTLDDGAARSGNPLMQVLGAKRSVYAGDLPGTFAKSFGFGSEHHGEQTLREFLAASGVEVSDE